jgi:hypothetical protein
MGLFDFLRGGSKEDRFASAVMKRLRERGWPHPLKYDRLKFEIDIGGDENPIYLGNIFRDWLKFPKAERPGQLDNAVAFVFEIGADDSWNAVSGKLLPLVRSRLLIESEMGPSKVLAASLSSVLAIDRESSIATVSDGSLMEWGLTFDEAFVIAMDNLRSRSVSQFEKQDGGFYLSIFGDWHDASRMLLPDLFEGLDLLGDPVAIAIVREGVVVAGR